MEQTAVAEIKRLNPLPTTVRIGESEVTEEDSVKGTRVAYVEVGYGQIARITRLHDGTALVALLHKPKLGGGVEVGPLTFGVSGSFQPGSTWKVANVAEAEALAAQLKAGTSPVRPPDLVSTEVAGDATLKAKVAPILGVSGSLEGKGEVSVRVLEDPLTKETTVFRSQAVTVEGKVAVDLGVRGAIPSGTYKLEYVLAEVRGADGRLTRTVHSMNSEALGRSTLGGGIEPRDPGAHTARPHVGVTLDQTTSSGQATNNITTLEVNDANRDVAEAEIAEQRAQFESGSGLTADPARYHPTTAVPGDEYQNELHRNATSLEADFDKNVEKDESSAGFKVPGFGLEAKSSVETSETGNARVRYLDAAGPDEVRRARDLPASGAAGAEESLAEEVATVPDATD